MGPLEAAASRVIAVDAVALAAHAGTAKAVGAVLIGVLAGLDRLPIPRDCWLDALRSRAPAKYRDANLSAFDAGFERARTT